jgi:hypothetical protein
MTLDTQLQKVYGVTLSLTHCRGCQDSQDQAGTVRDRSSAHPPSAWQRCVCRGSQAFPATEGAELRMSLFKWQGQVSNSITDFFSYGPEDSSEQEGAPRQTFWGCQSLPCCMSQEASDQGRTWNSLSPESTDVLEPSIAPFLMPLVQLLRSKQGLAPDPHQALYLPVTSQLR